MRRATTVLGSVLLIAGLVGCGGTGSGVSTGNDPDSWVGDVCSRMIALDHEVAAEATDLNAVTSAGGGPKVLLTSLDHFLGQVSDFAALAGGDLGRLGLPAIDAAQQRLVRSKIDELFKRFAAESGLLRNSVKRAALDSSSTAEQTTALLHEAGSMTDLDGEMRLILSDHDPLGSVFEASATCQRWVDLLDTRATTTTPSTTTTPPTTTVAPTTMPATTLPATTVPATTVPPTTVPATTIPAPTAPPTTVDLYGPAREQYLATAAEYNPKIDAVWASFFDKNGYLLYKNAPTYCDELATLEREWTDRMNAIVWPPEVQVQMQAHLAESAVLVGLFDQCAVAPATRAGEDALLTAIETEYGSYYAAVDALRVAIGLPPINN
jgi:hypothetical protein